VDVVPALGKLGLPLAGRAGEPSPGPAASPPALSVVARGPVVLVASERGF